jgi:proline iminopeptidase
MIILPFLLGQPSTTRTTLRVASSQLNCVIEGSGPACLVLGSSVYYPKTFSKELRRHFRFYFVDLRWFSPKYRETNLKNYTLETLVQDIDQIRTKLKLRKCILLGHSIHGTIAFEYAKRHPQNVSHLIMIGSPPIFGNATYDTATIEAWKEASPERNRLQAYNWSHPDQIRRLPLLPPDAEDYLAMAPKYWANPRYDARWLWKGVTINAPILHHLYDTIFHDYRMFDTTPKVPVPTFVAVGKFDFIVPPSLWAPYSKTPSLTTCIFAKSGHTPQLEEPTLFNETLLAWFHHQ